MLWLLNIIGFLKVRVPSWFWLALFVTLCFVVLWGYKSCQNQVTQTELQQQKEKAAEQSHQRIEALEKEEQAIEGNQNAIVTRTPEPHETTNDAAESRFCKDEIRCRHASCAQWRAKHPEYLCP